jgi:large subunit ribosomal protein L10
MAISKEKKEAQIVELVELFKNAKIAVTAKYTGLSVQDVQTLRKEAREANVVIKVVKNRLVKVALQKSGSYKDADISSLTDQLLYAFSSEDEVAPAQVLARFAKSHASLQLVSGYSDGRALATNIVNELASLPTKEQLRGQMVSVIAAPLTQLLGVAKGTQRSMTQILAQRAEAM